MKSDTHFSPGVSGNPRGRKPGTGSPAVRLQRAIEEHLGAIAEAQIQKALAGDSVAALAVAQLYNFARHSPVPKAAG